MHAADVIFGSIAVLCGFLSFVIIRFGNYKANKPTQSTNNKELKTVELAEWTTAIDVGTLEATEAALNPTEKRPPSEPKTQSNLWWRLFDKPNLLGMVLLLLATVGLIAGFWTIKRQVDNAQASSNRSQKEIDRLNSLFSEIQTQVTRVSPGDCMVRVTCTLPKDESEAGQVPQVIDGCSMNFEGSTIYFSLKRLGDGVDEPRNWYRSVPKDYSLITTFISTDHIPFGKWEFPTSDQMPLPTISIPTKRTNFDLSNWQFNVELSLDGRIVSDDAFKLHTGTAIVRFEGNAK